MARMFDALGTGPKPKGSRKPKKVAVAPSKVEVAAIVEACGSNAPAPILASIHEVVEKKIDAVVYSFFEVGPKGFLDGSPDVLTAKDVAAVRKLESSVHANIKAVGPEVQNVGTVVQIVGTEVQNVGTELTRVETPAVASPVVGLKVTEDACYAGLMRSLIAEFPTQQEGTLLFVTPPSVQIADTVLKLAKEAALWGEVVLVEAKENVGDLHRYLSLKEGPGWQDVIEGKIELEECIQSTGIAGLKVLTAGTRKSGLKFTPRLIARSPRALVRALRKQHRLILIDGGVWSEESGTLGLAKECDGICLLVPSSKFGSATVEEILGRIEDSGSRLAGVLVLPNQERSKVLKNAA